MNQKNRFQKPFDEKRVLKFNSMAIKTNAFMACLVCGLNEN